MIFTALPPASALLVKIVTIAFLHHVSDNLFGTKLISCSKMRSSQEGGLEREFKAFLNPFRLPPHREQTTTSGILFPFSRWLINLIAAANMSHCGPLRQMNKPTPDRSPKAIISPNGISNYLSACEIRPPSRIDPRDEAPKVITVNPDRQKGEAVAPKPFTLEQVKNALDSGMIEYYYMPSDHAKD